MRVAGVPRVTAAPADGAAGPTVVTVVAAGLAGLPARAMAEVVGPAVLVKSVDLTSRGRCEVAARSRAGPAAEAGVGRDPEVLSARPPTGPDAAELHLPSVEVLSCVRYRLWLRAATAGPELRGAEDTPKPDHGPSEVAAVLCMRVRVTVATSPAWVRVTAAGPEIRSNLVAVDAASDSAPAFVLLVARGKELVPAARPAGEPAAGVGAGLGADQAVAQQRGQCARVEAVGRTLPPPVHRPGTA